MAESTVPKLRHALKNEVDTRTPSGFSAIRDHSDPDWERKPTMAVYKGDEPEYEYRDGVHLVEVAVPKSGYDIPYMKERYENAKEEWRTFKDAKLRGEVFKKEWTALKEANPNQVQPDQVICTGIGTFSMYSEQYPHCNSYLQLADLEMFVKILSELSDTLKNKKINIFMQDPSFNELDKEFLRGQSFEIIEHPEAFNKMTATTFFYAPGNHDDVVYHAFRVAEPTLFIGDDLDAWGERNGLPNPNNQQYVAAMFNLLHPDLTCLTNEMTDRLQAILR